MYLNNLTSKTMRRLLGWQSGARMLLHSTHAKSWSDPVVEISVCLSSGGSRSRSYVTAGHKRNEKTVRPPLKNLRGIQMLDFFGRRSLLVGRAYDAFFGPRQNVSPSTNGMLIVIPEHDDNNNNLNFVGHSSDS